MQIADLYYDDYELAMAYGLGLSKQGQHATSATSATSVGLERLYPGIMG